MTMSSTSRIVRGSAAAAVACFGLLGLAACSGGGEQPSDEPTTSASSGSEESGEPSATPEATEEEAASGDATMCTAEQVTTLNSLSGTTVPPEALDMATATFEPAALIGDLPTTCVLTFEVAGSGVGSYAVMPGGAATISTVAANATAAGAQVTEAGGTFTGTIDGLTVAGVGFTALTQETAGFENVEDLVVIVSTGAFGG